LFCPSHFDKVFLEIKLPVLAHFPRFEGSFSRDFSWNFEIFFCLLCRRLSFRRVWALSNLVKFFLCVPKTNQIFHKNAYISVQTKTFSCQKVIKTNNASLSELVGLLLVKTRPAETSWHPIKSIKTKKVIFENWKIWKSFSDFSWFLTLLCLKKFWHYIYNWLSYTQLHR
jgi:hypothetical protein